MSEVPKDRECPLVESIDERKQRPDNNTGYLIRPDGYVGYHGRPMTGSGVFGYLEALS
jgi:hypothetical protein